MNKSPFLISIILLAGFLCSCSKKPVEVTGQIFVITQGRENVKMGGVRVTVISDKEFAAKAKEVCAWMREETKNDAQREIDGEHLTAFVREVKDLEENSPVKIAELETIRKSVVEESGAAKGLIQSALAGDLKHRAVQRMLAGLTKSAESTTDADGKFIVPIRGKTWFLAGGERKVGDNDEEYLWVKGFEAPEGATNSTVVISNDQDMDSDDELYAVFAGVSGVQETLADSRQVEVSEQMKSLVQSYREKVEKAIAMAGQFHGNRAGEEKIFQIAPDVTMSFCWCPPGEFMMGSPESEEGRGSDENQVKVTHTKGFWMAKTEVTQAQWQALMGSNPSYFKGANLPVQSVSWNDAQQFIEKLNAKVGNANGGQMALPTEAQWEYAARAGEAGPYSGGSIDEIAWYRENSGRQTQAVGSKKPNAWGLHDMQGNVWEWCADWYDEALMGGVDPRGPTSGSDRVFRGGSWGYYADLCRVAYRDYGNPGSTYGNIGFRVARSSVP